MVDGLNKPSFERRLTQAGRSHDGAIGAGVAAFGRCFFDKGCLLQPGAWSSRATANPCVGDSPTNASTTHSVKESSGVATP